MKKKLLYVLILIVSISGINSCKKYLDTESKSTYTTNVIFTTTDFINNAVMGIYSLMTLDETYSSRICFYYPMNTDIEITSYGEGDYGDNGRRGIGNYLATPGNTELEKPWNALYQAIERTNLVIDGIRSSELIKSDDDEVVNKVEQYLGEALTLRAIFYTELCRNWGDVPFKTEPTKPDGSNFFLPKTDRDTIYDKLILDLKEAETYIPWNIESVPERIGKAFVKGLMARIALYRGGKSLRKDGTTKRGGNYLDYYKLANQQCKEIIQSGTHDLAPTFEQFFYDQCQLNPSGNTESLFEIAHGLGESGEAGYYIGTRFNVKNDEYGYKSLGQVTTTPAYMYSFDSLDTRMKVTVAYYAFDGTAPKQILYEKANDLRIRKWTQEWMSDEFRIKNLAAADKLKTGINWCLMRYADVLLMYAETENEINNGPTAAAQEALKKVRRRAFPSSEHTRAVDNYVAALTSKTAFFNSIVDERAWEFGGEGIRKYDLIRWNLLGAKIGEAKRNNAKLVDRQPPYNWVPRKLFYYYKTSEPNKIELDSINLFHDRDTFKISGFTMSDWMDSTTSYMLKLDLMSIGFDSAKNNHLLPIAQTVIDDANGVFKNDFGF